MSITITRVEVKRKCMISSSDTSLDSYADALIAEMVPALEQTIDPAHLADSANTGLQALLKLGILELVSGELLAQRARESGFSEELQVGGVRIGQSWERGRYLTESGTLRLAPYLRSAASSDAVSQVRASFGGAHRLMDEQSMRHW